MKSKILIAIILSVLTLSCGNNKNQTTPENPVISNDQTSDQENQDLKAQGALGKWECNYTGFESIIYIYSVNETYSSKIDFKNNSTPKTEKLIKDGEKFLVENSSAKEYYVINSDGNLELWDKDGLFTTAKNLLSREKTQSLPEFNLKDSFQKNVFDITGNYSKSAPKTLDGTNNDFWIVYYQDINVTFKVDKKTDLIRIAKKGEVPNLK